MSRTCQPNTVYFAATSSCTGVTRNMIPAASNTSANWSSRTMRHTHLRQYDPRAGVSISTLAYEYPAGHKVPEHAHGSDQLIYATRGVMEISAGHSLWLTPPHLAV